MLHICVNVRSWPVVARHVRCSVHTCLASPPSLVIVVWLDAGDGKRAGDIGQRGCRSWSVWLATLVSCYGEGGPVAGVLHWLR